MSRQGEALALSRPLERDASIIQLGTVGSEGLRTFEVIGRYQRQFGPENLPDSPRNDWYLLWSDDSTGWLCEWAGHYFLCKGRAAPAAPEPESLKLGQAFHYEGGEGVVSSLSQGRTLACDGELPFAPAEEEGRLVEVSTSTGEGARLDYTHSPPLAFIGRWKRLKQLELSNLSNPVAGTVPCLTCQVSLPLHAPGLSQTLRCPYCGAQLDLHPNGAATGLVSSGEINNPYRPLIPLGTVAQLDGHPWTVVGAMRRWARIRGVRESWDMYLLYSVGLGFRWLSERNGHWTLWEGLDEVPTQLGRPLGRPKMDSVEYRGQEYQHFQRIHSRVEALVGEFPWRVRAGDELRTDDYVLPPTVLCAELGYDQISWRAGQYLPARQVWKLFRLPGTPVRQRGVGRNQPNPVPRTRYRLALYLASLLLATVGLWWRHGGWPLELAAQGRYPGPPLELRAQLPGSLNTVELQVSSEDLRERSAYVLVTFRRAEDASARAGGFNLYSFFARQPNGKPVGSSPQARLSDQAVVVSMPRGEYRVRVEADSQAVDASVSRGIPPQPGQEFHYRFRLRAEPEVPYWRLVLLAVLGALPMLRDLWRRRRFERERWKESDCES